MTQTVSVSSRIRILRPFIVVVGAGLVVGSTAAWSVHKFFTPPCDAPQTSETLPGSDSAGRGFDPGASLVALPLTDPSGTRHALQSLVKNNQETVLHFIDRECPPCMSNLATWADAADVAQVPVLFVACNEPIPVHELDGLRSQPSRLYSLLRPDHTAGGPRAVPLTVVVDRTATIIGTVRSVDDFLRNWDPSSRDPAQNLATRRKS